MNLNDLLQKHEVDPAEVLVVRHRAQEPELQERLPWLVANRSDLFNTFQQTQQPTAEKMFKKAKYVASFIGVESRTALFAGLYAVKGWKTLDYNGWWKISGNRELHKSFGMSGLEKGPKVLWFNLRLDPEFYWAWRGRLVINWPGGERAWLRWANRPRNVFEINSIHQASVLEDAMPRWDELVIRWSDMKTLSKTWQEALRQWRGIYYIWDSSDGRGYVGSAYGEDNILGRWVNYGKSGHGGNKKLKNRDPKNFQFSILERSSPDMSPNEVIALEQRWKQRLHTVGDLGLNQN